MPEYIDVLSDINRSSAVHEGMLDNKNNQTTNSSYQLIINSKLIKHIDLNDETFLATVHVYGPLSVSETILDW